MQRAGGTARSVCDREIRARFGALLRACAKKTGRKKEKKKELESEGEEAGAGAGAAVLEFRTPHLWVRAERCLQ